MKQFQVSSLALPFLQKERNLTAARTFIHGGVTVDLTTATQLAAVHGASSKTIYRQEREKGYPCSSRRSVFLFRNGITEVDTTMLCRMTISCTQNQVDSSLC